ncbi:MAG: hypothetical protein CMQ07_01340, partial [Gammaproteobacteria bacterium]|nr:hypothetical protein [Gammaproteobacteria bacterium]
MKTPLLQTMYATALLMLVAVLAGTPESGRANEPAASDAQYTWDLTEFYASKALWTTHLERLRGDVDFLAPYAGKLRDDASTLLSALDAN